MTSLPDGWEWATVGDVADIQLGRQRSPEHHQGPNMRPYLRAANVTWSGLKLDDVKRMNFDEAEALRFLLVPGDIVMNEGSGSPGEVGKPAIWNGQIEGCCFQNTLLRVRARAVLPGYLYWYFYFCARTGRFGEASQGVNIRHLGKAGLERFPVPLPPDEEQERLISALEAYTTDVDAAVASLSNALAKLAIFRDQVLEEAFAGRLADHPNGGGT
jgi:type I restriction enzyme S subunit